MRFTQAQVDEYNARRAHARLLESSPASSSNRDLSTHPTSLVVSRDEIGAVECEVAQRGGIVTGAQPLEGETDKWLLKFFWPKS